MTIIIGIDPGSRITGFGVVRIEAGRVGYLHSGCIRLPEDDIAVRLKRIYEELSAVIERFQPTEAAIERVFMNRNADSALKLGQARGAVIVAVGRAQVEVHEYSATQIKQAIVGRGHAQKDQVGHMVRVLLQLPHVPGADEADALAAAICHGHTRDSRARITLAGRARA